MSEYLLQTPVINDFLTPEQTEAFGELKQRALTPEEILTPEEQLKSKLNFIVGALAVCELIEVEIIKRARANQPAETPDIVKKARENARAIQETVLNESPLGQIKNPKDKRLMRSYACAKIRPSGAYTPEEALLGLAAGKLGVSFEPVKQRKRRIK